MKKPAYDSAETLKTALIERLQNAPLIFYRNQKPRRATRYNWRPVPRRRAREYLSTGNLFLAVEGDDRLLSTVTEIMAEIREDPHRQPGPALRDRRRGLPQDAGRRQMSLTKEPSAPT